MLEKKLKWKKIGKGSFRFNNRIIKPDETFEAYEHEIPKTFRDLLIPIGGASSITIGSEEVVTKVEKPEYELKVDENDEELFWVINKSTKKNMNQRALKKEKAEKLIKNLTEEIVS